MSRLSMVEMELEIMFWALEEDYLVAFRVEDYSQNLSFDHSEIIRSNLSVFLCPVGSLIIKEFGSETFMALGFRLVACEIERITRRNDGVGRSEGRGQVARLHLVIP